jgi:hypothetical protein
MRSTRGAGDTIQGHFSGTASPDRRRQTDLAGRIRGARLVVRLTSPRSVREDSTVLKLLPAESSEQIRDVAALGYGRMCLEALPSQTEEAIALYHSKGFRETALEGSCAKPRTLVMERDLT